MNKQPTYPRLMATYRPQVWHGDEAVNLEDRSIQFDATKQFLSLPLADVQAFKENNYDSDNLAENLLQRVAHTGPFEVDVDIDRWLEENGFENGRLQLTDEDLQTLRDRFGVVVHDYPGCTEIVPGVFMSPGDAVYIADDKGEVVMWASSEWVEDPEAVTATVHAVAMAASKGPAAVRAFLKRKQAEAHSGRDQQAGGDP